MLVLFSLWNKVHDCLTLLEQATDGSQEVTCRRRTSRTWLGLDDVAQLQQLLWRTLQLEDVDQLFAQRRYQQVFLLPGFTGFYRVLPGFTELYLVLPGFMDLYQVLMGLNRFYRVLMGFTGFYQLLTFLLSSCSRFNGFLAGFTRINWVLLIFNGFTGFHQVS